MKRIFIAALSLFFAAGGPPVSGRQENADPVEGLLRLYKGHRYFELHETLGGLKNPDGAELAFFRAVDASTGNRLGEAIDGFMAYLRGKPTDPSKRLAKEAWSSLADSYRRAGQYREAGETYRLLLERFGGDLEASERTNYESQSVLWSALADVSPQEVRILKESDIPMEKRSFPVRIGNKDIFVWHDTGSTLSVLYESAAKDLGCPLRSSGMKIQSAGGQWIESRVTVVPELRLGNAVVRNALFLVLPDSFFPVRSVRPGVERRGLIGAPILIALKEFIETKDGRLLIPAAPRPRSSFAEALRASDVSLIAEVKRASPSRGPIRPGLEVGPLVRAYEAAGARAVSVLTEEDHFLGGPDDLRAAAAVTQLPLLRKDFIVDEYQIHEARAWGADAVLLIAALLSDEELHRFARLAVELGLDVLLEVHDRPEMIRALSLEMVIIGINNRDLRTFAVSLGTTLDLAGLVPPERLLVSESGIWTHADIVRLAACGVSGVLVGESLLRSPDVGVAVEELMRPVPVVARRPIVTVNREEA